MSSAEREVAEYWIFSAAASLLHILLNERLFQNHARPVKPNAMKNEKNECGGVEAKNVEVYGAEHTEGEDVIYSTYTTEGQRVDSRAFHSPGRK